ncbi:MAG: tetratricopeptide repeat protein [Chloroflexi bacterium]|nr:tetratricopeptide repeat protein [Chloroflexota bacterium]
MGARGLTAWREKRDGVPNAIPFSGKGMSPPHAGKRKVLLIGWDAADWKAINPLMDAGYMPALEGLVNQGVIGNIATLDPPLSPMLWTSVATGTTADKHGIIGFTQPDPDHKRIRPVMATSRKGKAIWNILNQEGYRSHVVGWWPSHPAEPINGVTVSNFYHHARAEYGQPWPLPPGSIHPPRLTETLAQLRIHPSELTAAHLLPFVPKAAQIDLEKDKRLASVIKTIADCASVYAAATWTMENEPWDFMAVYYDTLDHFGHGFMKFHPPRRDFIPEELYDLYHYVIAAGYRFHDMMLEYMLTLAGPDTTVILLSDHGFHPDHLRPRGIPKEPAGPAIEHRHLGILCMKGPNTRPDERVYGASLLDIAPTVLTLFDLPVGRDMDGKPLGEVFDPPLTADYIPSWEEVAGDAGLYADDLRQDPWAEQAMMEQLVALGYVEPPGEDQQKTIDRSVCESQFWLARVYLSTGRNEEARPLLEELYKKAPDQRRYGLRLAQCYHDLDRLPDCRRLVEEIVAREETHFPALDLLQGMLLLAEEKPEDALQFLTRAEAADPQRPGLHQRIGNAYLQMEAWSRAEDAYQKALAIDPESAAAFHGLALAYLRQRRFEEAAEAALAAVGITYHRPAAHFHLGQALTRLGQYERAAEAYQVALSQAPGMRRAYLRLAELYERRLGQPETAARYRRLIEEQFSD